MTKGASCVGIFKTIAEKVGFPVSEAYFDVVYRVRAKEGQNIILRFCSRIRKTAFAAVAKKARRTGSAISFTGLTDENKAVSINNR